MLFQRQLPPELTDLIIDEVKAIQKDSRNSSSFSMRHLALVCKDWLPRVRYHAFSSVTLGCQDLLSDIAMIRNADIALYIRRLELNGGEDKTAADVSDIFGLLQLLPNLRVLNLRSILLVYRWHTHDSVVFKGEFKLEKLRLHKVIIVDHSLKSDEKRPDGTNQYETVQTSLEHLLPIFSSLGSLELDFVTQSGWLNVCRRKKNRCTPVASHSGHPNSPVSRRLRTLILKELYTPSAYFWPALSSYAVSELVLQPTELRDVEFLFRDGPILVNPQRLTLRFWHFLTKQPCSSSQLIPYLPQLKSIDTLSLFFSLTGAKTIESPVIIDMLDFLLVANTSIRSLILEIAIYDCDNVEKTSESRSGVSGEANSHAIYSYFDSVWPWEHLRKALQNFRQLEQLQLIFFGCSHRDCKKESLQRSRLAHASKIHTNLPELHRQGKLLVEWRGLNLLGLQWDRAVHNIR